MLRRFGSVVVTAVALGAAAQPVGPEGVPTVAVAERAPVVVTVGAAAEVVEGGPGQLAVPLAVEAPLGAGLAVGLRTAYAQAYGPGGLGGPDGLADVQATAAGTWAVGAGSVVATLGVNLPTGRRQLTVAEATTAYLVGQAFYGFPLPTWGQGLNVAPGVAVAWPLVEGVAIGAAAAVQTRGAFAPLAATPAELDPGDEVLLTLGLDARLGPATIAAVDVTGVRYGADVFDGVTYDVGDAAVVTGAVEHGGAFGEARLLARVSVRGEGEPPPVAAFRDTAVPLSARLQADVRFDLGRGTALGVLARLRRYDASAAFPAYTLADLALAPSFPVGPGLAVEARLGATVGDLRAVRLGLGARCRL